jgi:hypothetical protein
MLYFVKVSKNATIVCCKSLFYTNKKIKLFSIKKNFVPLYLFLTDF